MQLFCPLWSHSEGRFSVRNALQTQTTQGFNLKSDPLHDPYFPLNSGSLPFFMCSAFGDSNSALEPRDSMHIGCSSVLSASFILYTTALTNSYHVSDGELWNDVPLAPNADEIHSSNRNELRLQSTCAPNSQLALITLLDATLPLTFSENSLCPHPLDDHAQFHRHYPTHLQRGNIPHFPKWTHTTTIDGFSIKPAFFIIAFTVDRAFP